MGKQTKNKRAMQVVQKPVGLSDYKQQSLSVEKMIMGAIKENVPPETMERFLAMRDMLKKEFAKVAFDEAMAKFQMECPEIKKTKDGAKTDKGEVAFKYAPLESIVAQVKGLLGENGLSYFIKTKCFKGKVRSTCVAKHIAGHSEESSMESTLGTGNRLTTQAQLEAGASTFSKRYAFCNAFGIMTADEDIESERRVESPEVTKYIEELKGCTTKDKFNKVWKRLPKDVKASREVLAEAKKIKGFISETNKNENL